MFCDVHFLKRAFTCARVVVKSMGEGDYWKTQPTDFSVRLSGFQFPRVLVLLGDVALVNVIMVLSARGFGILDSIYTVSKFIVYATGMQHNRHRPQHNVYVIQNHKTSRTQKP